MPSLFAKPARNRSARSAPVATAVVQPSVTRPVRDGADADSVTILRFAHDGRGVARNAAGKTLFIEGALPGEQVRYKVWQTLSRYDEAIVSDILQPSPQRVEPECGHYAKCGGCSLQHLARSGQLAFKQAWVAEQLNWPVAQLEPALSGSGYACRRRARLGVKWRKDGRLLLGFRERNSAFLTEIHACPILTAGLQPLLPALQAFLPALAGRRHLGHLELFEADTGVGLLVRLLKPVARMDSQDRRLWQDWAKQQQIQVLLQDETGIQPLMPDQPVLFSYQLDGLTLNFSAGDFIQVNPEINSRMVAQALDWLQLQGPERVLDLFCGLGNFSLLLARRAAWVTGIEVATQQVVQARANAQANDCYNTRFVQADLEQPLDLSEHQWDVVLLDPPRAGAAHLSRMLGQLGAEKILYVSCNPATLARDARTLQTQGYRLQRLGIMDMFPQTAHVESMALFVRC